MTAFTQQDYADMRRARRLLETPSFAAKLISRFGGVIEQPMKALPARWSGSIQKYSEVALDRALKVATSTMDARYEGVSREGAHRTLITATGALGGFFGIKLLAVELPLSTVVMLRSIADIARSEGENVHSVDTKLACLEVFALGGEKPSDDSTETGYYIIRGALAKAVSDASRYITERGLLDEGAPALVRLIAQVASRFSITVTEKMAAQMVPVVGAVGGAAINLAFIRHFQDMARGHFIIRRLERIYGQQMVQSHYQRGLVSLR